MDRLHPIQAPTPIDVGDRDECTPELLEEVRRLIPGSELVVFPDSGRMTFVDQPTKLIAAVDGFPRR